MKKWLETFSKRILLTLVSPFFYALTNNETQNPQKKSYFDVLKEIWTEKLD